MHLRILLLHLHVLCFYFYICAFYVFFFFRREPTRMNVMYRKCKIPRCFEIQNYLDENCKHSPLWAKGEKYDSRLQEFSWLKLQLQVNVEILLELWRHLQWHFQDDCRQFSLASIIDIKGMATFVGLEVFYQMVITICGICLIHFERRQH